MSPDRHERLERVQRLGKRNAASPVKQVEIEPFGAKAFQAGMTGGNRAAPGRVLREHLADEKHLGAPAGHGVGDDLFGATVGVHFRRVDERHAEIEPEPERGNLLRSPFAVFPHAPRALAEDGDGLAGREQQGSESLKTPYLLPQQCTVCAVGAVGVRS